VSCNSFVWYSIYDMSDGVFQKLLGGYKQGSGIVCGCCDIEVQLYNCAQIFLLL